MSLLGRMLLAGTTGSARLARFLGYLAAGTRDHAELRREAEAGWDDYARDPRAPSVGLFDKEKRFYLNALPSGCRVLLVGCGSGRDLIGLIDAGRLVDGLDIAPRALADCRDNLARRGLDAPVFEGTLEEAAGRAGGPYDAVVFTWLAYGWVLESARRVATLRTAASLLKPGGRILLTYVPCGEPRGWAIGAAIAMSRLVGSDWRPEPGDSVEVSNPGGRPRLFIEHRFAPEEVLGEAKAAGLDVALHDVDEVGRVVLLRTPAAQGIASSTTSTAERSGVNSSS